MLNDNWVYYNHNVINHADETIGKIIFLSKFAMLFYEPNCAYGLKQ